MSSDAYFASQVLRAGLLGGAAMHSLPPPKSEREVMALEIMKKGIREEILMREMGERRILEEEVMREIGMAPSKAVREVIGREIMKKQIREEILAREMAERRILEQEVRMEIEMERIMEIRRFQMESGIAGTSGLAVIGNRPTHALMPPSLPLARVEASVVREIVQDAAEFEFRKRSPSSLVQKKTLAVAQSSLPNKSEKPSPSKESTTSKLKSCGANGKELEKIWGCALCELSANSEKALEIHLQGKKHKAKAKEALLRHNKKAVHLQRKNNNNNNNATTLHLPLPLPLKKKDDEEEGNKQHKQQKVEKKKDHPLGDKQHNFWCSICKVKCNCKIAMEDHLTGKKHLSLIKLKEANNHILHTSITTQERKKGISLTDWV